MRVVLLPGVTQLNSGRYIIADVQCRQCGQVVGWKYLAAFDRQQAHKTGTYVLERRQILPCERQR